MGRKRRCPGNPPGGTSRAGGKKRMHSSTKKPSVTENEAVRSSGSGQDAVGQPCQASSSKSGNEVEVVKIEPGSPPVLEPLTAEQQAMIDDLVGIQGQAMGRKGTRGTTLPKRFKCPFCPKEYALEVPFRKHLGEKHLIGLSSSAPQQNKKAKNQSQSSTRTEETSAGCSSTSESLESGRPLPPRQVGQSVEAAESSSSRSSAHVRKASSVSRPSRKAPVTTVAQEVGHNDLDPTGKPTIGIGTEDYEKMVRERDSQIEKLLKELKESREVMVKLGGRNSSGESNSNQTETSSSEIAKQVQGGEGERSNPTACSSSGAEAIAETHPLKIPKVLNSLFRLCDSKLLAKCRLVCKQWYEESLLTWRTLPIHFHPDINKGISNLKRPCTDDTEIILSNNWLKKSGLEGPYCRIRIPLQSFLAYCNDPKNQCTTKPFRSVKLYFIVWGPSEPLQELWGAIARNLTTLDLFMCTFNEEEFAEIVVTACPNLQKLQMDSCSVGKKPSTADQEYREPLYGTHNHLKHLKLYKFDRMMSWLELFSHFQSLAFISVKPECYRNSGTQFRSLIDAVKIVRKHNPKALPFKSVNIEPTPEISGDAVSQKTMEIIQELRLPLKALRINVQPGMNEAILKATLESIAEAVPVTDLVVIGTDSAALGHPFPFGVQLDHLETLVIKEHLCENLTFLKFTPNLKSLAISGDEDPRTKKTESHIISNSCKDEMANVKMFHLQELKIDNTVSDQDLANLYDWFPSFASLRMPLTDKQFGIVCEKWKTLKSLSVQGCRLTDAGVTGRGNLEGEPKKKGGSNERSKEVTRPNITDLQNLEEFEFTSYKLTDETVFHGLLKLSKLKKIKSECYTLD